jgi:hypothetical protein
MSAGEREEKVVGEGRRVRMKEVGETVSRAMRSKGVKRSVLRTRSVGRASGERR